MKGCTNLYLNLFLTEQPKSQSFDFGKIGEVQGETTETVVTARIQEGRGDEKRGQVILSSRLVTFLSCLRCFILQNEIVCIAARCNHCYQKARAILILCFDADVFNLLTFTEEAEREISVKDIWGSLKESFVNEKIIEKTENEFIHYQSHMIGHVESVTIEEASECVGEDQQQTNTTLRRSRRARKKANFEEFMY